MNEPTQTSSSGCAAALLPLVVAISAFSAGIFLLDSLMMVIASGGLLLLYRLFQASSANMATDEKAAVIAVAVLEALLFLAFLHFAFTSISFPSH